MFFLLKCFFSASLIRFWREIKTWNDWLLLGHWNGLPCVTLSRWLNHEWLKPLLSPTCRRWHTKIICHKINWLGYFSFQFFYRICKINSFNSVSGGFYSCSVTNKNSMLINVGHSWQNRINFVVYVLKINQSVRNNLSQDCDSIPPPPRCSLYHVLRCKQHIGQLKIVPSVNLHTLAISVFNGYLVATTRRQRMWLEGPSQLTYPPRAYCITPPPWAKG